MSENNHTQGRKFRRLLICGVAALLAVLFAGGMIINQVVVIQTMDQVVKRISDDSLTYTSRQMRDLKAEDADCIIVLGASVLPDGEPSLMLEDRLDAAINLYKKGIAPKLLLSGDNGQKEYNELKVMAEYAESKGVAKKDIFCDYAGFSTYETIFRARQIFQVDRAIVVTQSYHLYRALYGCNRMGIQALGVASDQATYSGQRMRDGREFIARIKDFFMWAYRPDPTYLGDEIPIDGIGNCKF